MNPYLPARKSALYILLGVFALAANGASAASLTVTGYTLGDYVSVSSPSRNGSVATAELNLSFGGTSGYSYCVDLAQSIGVGTTTGWDALDPAISAQVIRAAWLVDTFHPEFASLGSLYGVTKQTEIAALQVAVWEVMGETPGNYDLTSGSFSITKASAGVWTLSNLMLTQLGTVNFANFDTNAVWLQSRTYQDQLFYPRVNPIPEPGTLGLYGFGALLAAFGLRRKA
jgi:PEP-CTERM motif-containing protein